MKVEVTPKQINPPSREKVVHQVPAKYSSTKRKREATSGSWLEKPNIFEANEIKNLSSF